MTDEVTLVVEYSCAGCRIVLRPVAVRERRGPEESVLDWVREIQERVSEDHAATSPGCRAGAFDLKIPFSHSGWIGKAVRQ